MVNSLSILGSTGSIGTQTLDVADKLNLKVSAACIPSHENERINPEHAHYVAYDSYVDELSAKNLRMGNAFAGQRSD